MSYLANVAYQTDEHGKEVARIELSNRPGMFCVMDRADWLDWEKSGRAQAIMLQPLGPGRYGLAFHDRASKRAGTLTTVARAIMQPPYGKVVYRNSPDILDMRRRNLRLQDRYRVRDNSYADARADGLL